MGNNREIRSGREHRVVLIVAGAGADHDVFDGDPQLAPETFELACSCQVSSSRGWVTTTTASAPEVPQLVLDRGGRIGITDFSARDEPAPAGPRERLVKPLARLRQLGVDIGYGVV